MNRARVGSLLVLGVPVASLLALCACQPEPVTLGRNGAPAVAPPPAGEGGTATVTCETASVETQVDPTFLGIAFDASGSMGELDCPYWNHDPELKWRPVVDAVAGFLGSQTAGGMQASMTLFPARSDKCDDDQYDQPDVPMTPLPSERFREVLESYEKEVRLVDYPDPMPPGGAEWRSGTPTAAVVTAGLRNLDRLRLDGPGASFALVLVTDGAPSGCGDNAEHLVDTLRAVEEGRELGILTFVIGVEEPPLPPPEAVAPWEEDGMRVWACLDEEGHYRHDYADPDQPLRPENRLENLNAIAEAGGTGRVFLIDTGDPDRTQKSLADAIGVIQKRTFACGVGIPEAPSPEVVFSPENLDVRVSTAQGTERLAFDPACLPGGGWHYDSDLRPEAIVLCDETCSRLQSEREAKLTVDFLCEERQPVIR